MCVAFSVDNASVNMGKIIWVKSRVLVKNPDVFFVGCSNHMAHNAACKGEDSFSGASRFDVEPSWGFSCKSITGLTKVQSVKWTKWVLRILLHYVFI